jgi:hypothetical protein
LTNCMFAWLECLGASETTVYDGALAR